jgi:dienelactone hydrolase
MARNLWDLRRSLDVLGTIAPGNPERFGVVGWSYGAALAVLLAAVDDRVVAAVASGFVSSWRAAHRVPWNLCGRQVFPGLLGDLEHRDVAALVAPRALLVESAQDDLLAPADEAERTVAEIRRAYGLLGADPAVVDHDVVPGGHDWNGRSVVAFLDDHLTG